MIRFQEGGVTKRWVLSCFISCMHCISLVAHVLKLTIDDDQYWNGGGGGIMATNIHTHSHSIQNSQNLFN